MAKTTQDLDSNVEANINDLFRNTTNSRDTKLDESLSPGGVNNTNKTFSVFSDTELGPSDLDSIPDVNVYQHKKTVAQGMMDIALFSANTNQLRYVMDGYRNHPYFYPSIVMISISLILQVLIGVGLIWNSRYNVKDDKHICIANKINNYTVIGIFVVTSLNVFICSFSVASAPIVIAAPATTPAP